MKITYKTKEEIELMRESALIVSKTLGIIAEELREGITTLELDAIAETAIRDMGAVPGFKGYGGFPSTLCTSVNEEVVHGIPNNRPLQSGDIISIDCGAIKNEFYGDHAYTFTIGEVSGQVKQLLKVTKESLYLGIEQTRVNNRLGDIGFAIQKFCERQGYGVVRELVGHGLGKNLHEKPEVANYGKRGSGLKLQEGLVIAIEPMINMGSRRVKQLKDGWTIVTADKKPSAHFEHDIAIVDGQPEILSTFDHIYEALEKKEGVKYPRTLEEAKGVVQAIA